MQDAFTTQVIQCDPSSIAFSNDLEAKPEVHSEASIEALSLGARHLVDEGNVVAFPTETVYGLGANALNPTAISRIFSTKGRPSDNPLIVHVSSLSMLKRILPDGYEMSPTYRSLVENFWPGALTLLFPAPPDSTIIPKAVTAGHAAVAIRMPSHPVARALIALSGVPLAAPSANSSGKPSPTRAEHVERDLGGKVPIIIDGGPCDIGVESTVIDGLNPDGNLRVLRPGGVTVEDLEKAVSSLVNVPKVLVHRRDFQDEAMEQAPTTPGMKYRHYSPSVPVTLVMLSSTKGFASFADLIISASVVSDDQRLKIGLLAPSDSLLLKYEVPLNVNVHHFALGPRGDLAANTAGLYDGLLTLEREGVDFIIMEGVAEEREGLAFMNRARKAAGETKYLLR